MMIDNYYKDFDKNHFYLGMINQVYRTNSVIQIENLSLLKYRKLKDETLIPNTINYLVVIDSPKGMFLGEIYQAKILNKDSLHYHRNNDENIIHPESYVNILGFLENNNSRFELPGFNNVGLKDKVYIANKEIIDLYLDSVEIRKGLGDELTLSEFSSFSNLPTKKLKLRPSTLFNRHLMAIGTTNSGKSTTALSILDKLIKNGKKVLLIDPTGEYKESFCEQEITKLVLGENTVLPVGELDMTQWTMLFETNDGTQPAVLYDAIKSLRFQKKAGLQGPYKKSNQLVSQVDNDMDSVTDVDKNFELISLPAQISEETNQIGTRGRGQSSESIYVNNDFNFNQKQWLRQKVDYKLSETSLIDFFSNDGVKHNLLEKIDEFILNPETSLYIDASTIGTTDGVGGMIVDLVSNYIMKQKEINPFVLFIDEIHRYTRNNYDSNSNIGLTIIAREGRKKGVFLFLTTQTPHDVPSVLLGQVGTLLIHRLTHKNEVEAVQNYLSEVSVERVRNLNQGEAILTSINLIQDIMINVIASTRIHNNSTPKL